MKNLFSHSAIALSLAGMSLGLQAQTAQTAPSAEPAQLVNLSASAFQQAKQDWLHIVVRTTIDGTEPMQLQKQLKKTVDEALTLLQPQVQPRQLEVHTGQFSINPRYNDKGRVVGWQGQADLVVEGRDFAKVSQAAGEVPRMAVESTYFSLSREGRQQLEADVQSQAVQNFRQKAQQLAKDFGYNGYTLRQVTVSTVERPTPPMPMAAMARTLAADAAPSPIPVEAGKDEVKITVSGSVQLR